MKTLFPLLVILLLVSSVFAQDTPILNATKIANDLFCVPAISADKAVEKKDHLPAVRKLISIEEQAESLFNKMIQDYGKSQAFLYILEWKEDHKDSTRTFLKERVRKNLKNGKDTVVFLKHLNSLGYGYRQTQKESLQALAFLVKIFGFRSDFHFIADNLARELGCETGNSEARNLVFGVAKVSHDFGSGWASRSLLFNMLTTSWGNSKGTLLYLEADMGRYGGGSKGCLRGFSNKAGSFVRTDVLPKEDHEYLLSLFSKKEVIATLGLSDLFLLHQIFVQNQRETTGVEKQIAKDAASKKACPDTKALIVELTHILGIQPQGIKNKFLETLLTGLVSSHLLNLDATDVASGMNTNQLLYWFYNPFVEYDQVFNTRDKHLSTIETLFKDNDLQEATSVIEVLAAIRFGDGPHKKLFWGTQCFKEDIRVFARLLEENGISCQWCVAWRKKTIEHIANTLNGK